MTLWRCAFDGCPKTSEQPGLDGWTGFELDDEYPGFSGLYCPKHARALEAVLNEDDEDDEDDDEDDEDNR